MDAKALSLQDLFHNEVQYQIPEFQRQYIWNQDDQWEYLWADVARTANDLLDNDPSRVADHFLGAIVLQLQKKIPGELDVWRVIDGQQRLTILQLLLAGAQLTLGESSPDVHRYANRVSQLTANSDDYVDPSRPSTRFKVWPTSLDRGSFEKAMSTTGDPSGFDETSSIEGAHKYFREHAKLWLEASPGSLAERATALDITLRAKLKVVAISLDDTDDPNVIFEALNARGTPLLHWDLAKNHLIHAEAQTGADPDLFYDTHLRTIEQDGWWRDEVRQGRLYVPRIDAFLFYWLSAKTRQTVSADGVFDEFQSYTSDRDHRKVAEDIATFANTYKKLETTAPHTPLGRFVRRWRAMELGMLTPQLLWLLSNDLQDDVLQRCLEALESYFVRRMVCRISTAGLNVDLMRMLRELSDHGPENADRTVVNFLSTQRSERAHWPDDQSFVENLTHGRLYGRLAASRTRMIIEAINEKLQDDAATVILDGQVLFIEHVMPQKWQMHYPLPSGSAEDHESRLNRREHLIHTLGNLTLTTATAGRRMSAGPSEVKREVLKGAGLAINTELLDNAGDTWDDEVIVARSKRLASLALEIWPRPEQRFRLL